MESGFIPNDIVLQKLLKSRNEYPKIVFADFDGTLFTSSYRMFMAPLYNLQTKKILAEKSIPFVVVTGRSTWNTFDRNQALLLGFSNPDIVVTADGTIIYHKNPNNSYSRDINWENIMQSSKVMHNNGNLLPWNKQEIAKNVYQFLNEQNISFIPTSGNTFLIRMRMINLPIEKLRIIQNGILQLFPKGIKVVFSESTIRKNTLENFSGDLFVIPSVSGKENAIKYLLEFYSKQVSKILGGFIFGDATVDIAMLSIKNSSRYYSLEKYLVHPTPLAYKILKSYQKSDPNLFITISEGPQTILKVVKNFSLYQKVNFFDEPPPKEKPKLTPAQNSRGRKLLVLFAPILDKIMNKDLAPNEISLIGFKKVKKGIDNIYENNNKLLIPFGIYNVFAGSFIDLLDGIRARRGNASTSEGQLIDVFFDRLRDFYQLYTRALKRFEEDEEKGYLTLLAAISASLPGVARAQAEVTGKIVPEVDNTGGSALSRSNKLIYSLLIDVIGNKNYSFEIDKKIYSASLSTFQNRLTFAKDFDLKKIKIEDLDTFEKKALERFLFLAELLQEEDEMIEFYLRQYPKEYKEYQKFRRQISFYLKLNAEKYRKQWNFKNYGLSLKKFF